MQELPQHTDRASQSDAAPKQKGSVIVLAISVFLNIAGFTLILPVIPFLVGQYVPPEQVGLYVGLIVSVFALCAFCAAPVMGALSDRYGRRPILMLSLFGSTIGYVIFGLGGALWVLFVGRIIDGLTAGNISTVYAYVADTFAPEERGRIYGVLGAVGGLGFMLGPVAGGLLGAIYPAAPLFAAAALTLVSIAWIYLALPESLARDAARPAWRWQQLNPLAQLAQVLGIAALRIPFAAAFAFFFSGAMLQSNFAVYLKDILQFGPTGIGWILFTVGVMDIVAQGLLTRILLPRLGADLLTRVGLAVNAIGFGLIACLVFVPRVEFLLASIVVFTLGDGLFQPPMNAIISNAAPADAQGLVQGANQSQQAMARMLGPLLAAVLSPFSAAAPYWAGGLIAMMGVVILLISGRSKQPAAE
ncbi:MFS transporter [Bradyrhizobium sp. dw_411]|uniref:MFS transporter n=1 Tax=Bradyrhizobium sp. dw_411 TaxID=2720082 RepID=UPI001BCCBCFE|nr:MFS transporter [Bradyrhizobium sp. dw_411]